MPICEECRWEADRGPSKPGDFLVEALQLWHNFGSHAPMGHSACKGGTHCYCAHLPHGSWRGNASEEA